MGDISEFLKPGTRYLSGLEEAILRNIEACGKLTAITRTSLGPNGLNKLVVNRLEKLFVTSDAATILRELDIVHPAAKMLVLAAQMQASEVGDATNLTLVLAGELLAQAEALLRIGLHPSDVVAGYTTAAAAALDALDTLDAHRLQDLRSRDAVARVLRAAIASKQYGLEELLAPLVADACIAVLPRGADGAVSRADALRFDVDSVRVVKVVGGATRDSRLVRGMVFTRGASGAVQRADDTPKVAVFAAGIDIPKTETKHTVLFENADELLDFSKGEERQMEEIVDAIASAGVRVAVSGGAVGELALHYLDRHGIMVVKVPSKFDLRRLCRLTRARPLVRLGAPTADELGSCASVRVEEIGSTTVTVFEAASGGDGDGDGDDGASPVVTLVVRGSTLNLLDDIERAVDDGVNVFKQATRDARFVPGAGATEMELARRLTTLAEQTPGLDQYAIARFAEAFEVVPRTLAETAGVDTMRMLTVLKAAHAAAGSDGEGDDGAAAAAAATPAATTTTTTTTTTSAAPAAASDDAGDAAAMPGASVRGAAAGVDIESGGVLDAAAANVWDLLYAKRRAIKLASDAAITILRVDSLIVAKPAGGPNLPRMGARDA